MEACGVDSRSDRIVIETLGFLRRVVDVSAAVFYWVDERMDIVDFEVLDMPSGFMARYNSGMKELDPALVRRLADANKKIGTLDDQDIEISTDYRQAYRSFLNQYDVVDVVDFLFRTESKAVAGIGLLKYAGAKPFSYETIDWLGIHQYLEFNIQMHPQIRKTQARLGLKERFGLTNREDEVARLIAAGASNPQVAQTLGIALSTVKTYALHIFDKVGVENRASLISLLLREQYC